MKFGDKVFVVHEDKQVLPGLIHDTLTLKGVVTGYYVSFPDDQSAPPKTAFVKGSVFTDEEGAKKELFLRKLKSDEKKAVPSQDKKSDRHWIPGYGSRRRPRQ